MQTPSRNQHSMPLLKNFLFILGFGISFFTTISGFAQAGNQSACESAINLGILNVGEKLEDIHGDNRGSDSYLDPAPPLCVCTGEDIIKNVVYYEFELGNYPFLKGVKVTLTPKSNSSFILAYGTESLCTETSIDKQYLWCPSQCPEFPGQPFSITFGCVENTSGNLIGRIEHMYILVGGEKGTFELTVEAIDPTFCDGCQNGRETSVDLVPFSLSSNSSLEICEGEEVILEATEVPEANSYQWYRTFQSTETLVTETTEPTLNIDKVGDYQVDAKIECESGDSPTLLSSNTLTVNQIPQPPAEVINSSGPTDLCVGEEVILSVQSNPEFTYQWEVNGNTLTGETSSELVVKSKGEYRVAITNECDVTTFSSSLSIIEIPPISNPVIVNTGTSEFCEGENVILTVPFVDGVIYQWKRDGSDVGTDHNELIVDKEGSYTVELSNRCQTVEGTNNIYILVKQTPQLQTIVANGETDICEDENIELSVPIENEVSYIWQLNGQPIGDNANTLTASQTGTYTLTMENNCGMTEITTGVNVEVFEYPTSPTVFDGGACPNEPVTLGAEGTQDGNFQWYDNNLQPIDGAVNGEFITDPLSLSTGYHVSVFNGPCESELVPVLAKIYPLPEINLQGDTIIRKGSATRLRATGGVTYEWSPSFFLDDPNSATPVASPLETTMLAVRATSEEGCVAEEEITIRVIDDIKIWNAFSPNSDGHNDTWVIDNIDDYPNVEIEIFDERGQLIFHSIGYDEPWDGRFQNGQLPSSTTTVFYHIMLNADNTKPLTGFITIMI